MPCDYSLYPPDWKWIRRQILDQAGNRCEFCNVENRIFGVRLADGSFYELDDYACDVAGGTGEKCIRIVLTIAHLDHDINNNDPSNLRALCQRCHLRWDHEHHLRNSGKTRRERQTRAGQTSLLEVV